jgi:endogenous inhibitor of DNA gyrase (YacG/DUF329 family)
MLTNTSNSVLTCEECGGPITTPQAKRFCSRRCQAIALNRKTPEEQLFAPGRCLKTDGCWLWQGNTNRKGYGTIRFRGVSTLAHKAVYLHLYGSVPEGKEIDHICRVRNCVRPDHLQAITHQENVARTIYAKSAITAFGETKSQIEWTKDARCTVGPVGLSNRLISGMTPEEAISKPRRAMKHTGPVLITAFGDTKGPVEWSLDPRCRADLSLIYWRVGKGMTGEPVLTPPRPMAKRGGTTCGRGHEYTPDNTRITFGGTRRCITCDKAKQARRPARVKARNPYPSEDLPNMHTSP